MYAILISKSDDEIKQTIKELFSDVDQLQFSDHKNLPEYREPPCCRINTAKGIYNIPHSDILFVESGQKKSIFHLTKNTISLPVPLYRIGEALLEPYFIQTHRSFIVNIRNVSFIDKTKDPWVISFFDSNKTAFVSRSFKKDVMQAISPLLTFSID